MSSYMLDDDKWQLIANWLWQASHEHNRHQFCVRQFLGFEPGTKAFYALTEADRDAAATNAVRNLYNLNRLALVTRYSEPYDRKDETKFVGKFDPMATDIKAIQALRELRYQCAEYMVMDTKQFDELDRFIGKVCEDLVTYI